MKFQSKNTITTVSLTLFVALRTLDMLFYCSKTCVTARTIMAKNYLFPMQNEYILDRIVQTWQNLAIALFLLTFLVALSSIEWCFSTRPQSR